MPDPSQTALQRSQRCARSFPLGSASGVAESLPVRSERIPARSAPDRGSDRSCEGSSPAVSARTCPVERGSDRGSLPRCEGCRKIPRSRSPRGSAARDPRSQRGRERIPARGNGERCGITRKRLETAENGFSTKTIGNEEWLFQAVSAIPHRFGRQWPPATVPGGLLGPKTV